MNKGVTVTVSGLPNSGKTAIQVFIVNALKQRFSNVEIDWCPDGDPNRTDEQYEHIADKLCDMPIKVVTQNLSRFSAK